MTPRSSQFSIASIILVGLRGIRTIVDERCGTLYDGSRGLYLVAEKFRLMTPIAGIMVLTRNEPFTGFQEVGQDP